MYICMYIIMSRATGGQSRADSARRAARGSEHTYSRWCSRADGPRSSGQMRSVASIRIHPYSTPRMEAWVGRRIDEGHLARHRRGD